LTAQRHSLIEKVVQALTARQFSRSEFLKPLDRFYLAIERTTATIDDFLSMVIKPPQRWMNWQNNLNDKLKFLHLRNHAIPGAR